MKKIYLISALLLFFNISQNPASAQTSNPTPTVRPTPTPDIDREQERISRRIESLKQRANTEINRGIINLNVLINRITINTELTNDQKSKLISNIQTQITKLNDLRTKIQNSNDLPTIEEDFDQIRDIERRTNRLYRTIINLLEDANDLLADIEELNQNLIKIDNAIIETGNRGVDTAGLQAIQGEIRKKINESISITNNAINSLLELQPDEEDNSEEVIDTARRELRNARRRLLDARRDTQSIINELINLYRDYLRI
jgi:hypothetical protein